MYRGAGRFRKIRKLTSNNQTGDAYGVTIPKNIAERFLDISLLTYISGNSIILSSGCIKQK